MNKKEFFNKKWLLDGAMGTVLISEVGSDKTCLEELNVSSPNEILKIHKKYHLAGSQIVFTNTFGANLARLKANGHEDRFHEINSSVLHLVKDLKSDDKIQDLLVFGSIGPTGLTPQELMKMSDSEVEAIFISQYEILSQELDGVVFETIHNFYEFKILLSALKKVVNSKILNGISFSVKENGDFYDGTPLKTVLDLCDCEAIDFVGLNCSFEPAFMSQAFQNFKKNSKKPMMIKFNAGMPVLLDDEWVYPVNAEDFASQLVEYMADIHLVGGCCGTTPAYIQEIQKQYFSKK